MTSPEERIKELARKSAIDPAAAERLLAAVRPEPPLARRAWDPFERWGAGRCLLVGVVSAFAGALLSRSGFRYEGFLDLTAAYKGVSWSQAIVDQLAAFPLGALVFWCVGRLLAKQVRVVDMFATVGLSRAPATVFSIPMAFVAADGPSNVGLSAIAVVAVAIVLVGTGLQVTTLVLGFRSATGLRGARLTLGFVGALIAAEVVSKLVVSLPH